MSVRNRKPQPKASTSAQGQSSPQRPVSSLWASLTTSTNAPLEVPMEAKWPALPFLAVSFAIPFVVYMLTLNVDMVGGDWAELVVSQYQFSVPHPPGYPTFMALGWLWIHGVPIPGSVAYRANVLSALLSALSAVVMFLTIRELLTLARQKRPSRMTLVASLFGSAFFALSPIVWMYSIHAEVFPLNNLLVALLFYLMFRFQRRLEFSTALAGAFMCGLALTNQHTSVVFEAIIVPWILWVGRGSLFTLPRLFKLGIAGLLGLSPYALLFVSQAIKLSKYSWGDLLTLHGYFVHLSRQEYGSFQLYKSDGDADTAPTMVEKLLFYLNDLRVDQIGLVGIGLAIFGVYWCFTSRRVLYNATGMILGFLLYVSFFFYLCNLPIQTDKLYAGVFQRFFPQPNLILAIIVGLGAHFAYKKSPQFTGKRVVLVLVLALCLGSQIYANFNRLDQSQNRYFRQYAKGILDPLPNGSILLLKGDLETNSVSYLQHVEGYRPDLFLLSVNHMTYDWWLTRQQPLYPEIDFPGIVYHPHRPGGYNIGQFMVNNIQRGRNIYLCSGWKPGDESWKNPAFRITKYGLTEHITLAPAVQTLAEFEWELKDTMWNAQLRALEQDFPSKQKYGYESWEIRYYSMYWELKHIRALGLLDIAMKTAGKPEFAKVYQRAIELCMKDLESLIEPFSDPLVSPQFSKHLPQALRNLGILYDHMKQIRWNEQKQAAGNEYLHKMLNTWERYLEIEFDKTVADAVKAWKSYQIPAA